MQAASRRSLPVLSLPPTTSTVIAWSRALSVLADTGRTSLPTSRKTPVHSHRAVPIADGSTAELHACCRAARRRPLPGQDLGGMAFRSEERRVGEGGGE